MTIEEFLTAINPTQRPLLEKFRTTFQNHLPNGFEETILYNSLAWVVPLSIYPNGYHAAKNQPLPFINLNVKKNGIHLYHLGLYTSNDLLQWFISQWQKTSSHKPDFGKSCLRFKYPNEIPFTAIEELAQKFTPRQWIDLYEKNYKPEKSPKTQQ